MSRLLAWLLITLYMNITELARILKITPQELREWLPRLGFDIGQKAIKIDNKIGSRIINQWPKLKRQMEREKRLENEKIESKEVGEAPIKKISVPKSITIRELSAISEVPVSKILSILMQNGIFVSLNEKVDYDTAWLIGSELNLEISKQENENKETEDAEDRLKDILSKEENLISRPPVIVIMGHVDHGKTKLLDAIRRTDVVAGEAGGITQHIGAYQVNRNNRLITFIDTPGHEAFTAMRGRGAKIADIAILIVAADDGVKTQTTEAFRIIEAAKIPFVVAINKIDKPEANIEKTKQELSNKLGILPEDWGGKTICVPISALEGKGIDELLDMVLLSAETDSDSLKANPDAEAVGTIIESHIDKGAGPVATILIQNGTLRLGDNLTLDGISMGKVRAMIDHKNEKMDKAEPSQPVKILGLRAMPRIGDILEVGKGERHKGKVGKRISNMPGDNSSDSRLMAEVNLVIKSDVLGSAEAIEESLAKINTEKVRAKIIHKGMGNISEGDVKRAEAANALIIGFNIKVSPQMEDLAREKNVEIKCYNVIYNLLKDVKEKMKSAVKPTIKRVDLGELKVLAVFKTEKDGQIVGGKVISGQIDADSSADVYRGETLLEKGKLSSLQSGKQNVSSCHEGEECGLKFNGDPVILEGDIMRFYKEVEVENTL
jgi:translation initiation factor IF-2